MRFLKFSFSLTKPYKKKTFTTEKEMIKIFDSFLLLLLSVKAN